MDREKTCPQLFEGMMEILQSPELSIPKVEKVAKSACSLVQWLREEVALSQGLKSAVGLFEDEEEPMPSPRPRRNNFMAPT